MNAAAASLRLRHILERADALGVRGGLAGVQGARQLLLLRQTDPGQSCSPSQPLASRPLRKVPRPVILAALAAVLVAAALRGWRWWYDHGHRECLLEVPDRLTLAARPPVDCAMCRELRSVDRVRAITPQDFESRYAYSGRPVVVQDAMSNWSAPQTFTFDFLKSIYAESLSELDSPQDRCQFFPYSTDFRGLREVFDMDADRAAMKPGSLPWYVGWSNCDEKVARELRTHYGRPYFLPNLSENKNVDWIFMGSSGYGAGMHVDNVRHPSWQAQLRGAKLWSLQPPPECIYECESFSVTVEPGEVIVLDTNRWYHSTKIVSEDISITIGAEYD